MNNSKKIDWTPKDNIVKSEEDLPLPEIPKVA